MLRHNAPECTALLAGMAEWEHGMAAAEAAMHSAVARERLRMETNLTTLHVLAQSATLLGLLGTVLGVIGSLKGPGVSLVDAHGALSPAFGDALSALASTAAGLAVAIPAAAAGILYQRRVHLTVGRSEVLIQVVLTAVERQRAAKAAMEAARAAAAQQAEIDGTAAEGATGNVIAMPGANATNENPTKVAKAA